MKLVDDAKRRIQEITASDLQRKLEQRAPVQILDVREAEEYAAGRIPGARNLCKGILERDVESAVSDLAAEIILYCGGGFRSALAADNLQKMGYTKVSSLAGGWRNWTSSGLPTEKP